MQSTKLQQNTLTRRPITKKAKDQLIEQQQNRCNNKPGSNLWGIGKYECPLWKLNDGIFDESSYQVDHIIEHSITGDNNIANLQLLCCMCHTVKTKNFMRVVGDIDGTEIAFQRDTPIRSPNSEPKIAAKSRSPKGNDPKIAAKSGGAQVVAKSGEPKTLAKSTRPARHPSAKALNEELQKERQLKLQQLCASQKSYALNNISCIICDSKFASDFEAALDMLINYNKAASIKRLITRLRKNANHSNISIRNCQLNSYREVATSVNDIIRTVNNYK